MKKQVQKSTFFLMLVLFTKLCAQSWQVVGTPGFSAGGANSSSISLGFGNSGKPYVAYADTFYNSKMSVMKFNGTSWENVGTPGFTENEASLHPISLRFSNSGEPYVACNGTTSSRALVMKFNGTSWGNVGVPGFSEGSAWDISLAFSNNGEPYVAYADYGPSFSGKIRVMKFNGTLWENVGVPGFSEGSAPFNSLAFSNSGEPYVAYTDYGSSFSGKVRVMKFNGISWENVGISGFSSGAARNTSLIFNTMGEPYVAYSDGANSNKATVMKFNGVSWGYVGIPGFSPADTYVNLSFALSNGDEPYVAFGNGTSKAMVMKFNGISWVNVGVPGFSAGGVNGISLAISSTGEPYVAYGDIPNPNNFKATVMKFTNTLGTNDLEVNNIIPIYPNPAKNTINIDTKENNNISIIDISGKILSTQKLNIGKNTIDISNLSKGIYFIQNEKGNTVKLIKE